MVGFIKPSPIPGNKNAFSPQARKQNENNKPHKPKQSIPVPILSLIVEFSIIPIGNRFSISYGMHRARGVRKIKPFATHPNGLINPNHFRPCDTNTITLLRVIKIRIG